MRLLRRLFAGQRDREIAEEIRTHIDMATRERIERGEAADAARTAALREFGNVGLVVDATREVWMSTRVEQLFQDVRFGARVLWQAPALSATAIALVALVIGGNTTVYSMVRALLASPAPDVTRDHLVAIAEVSPTAARFGPFTSYPNYLDYVAQAKTVERLTAWSDERLTIGTPNGNYAVYGALVTTAYFDTLGVQLLKGRGFRPADERLDAGGLVAVISTRCWRDYFQSDPDIIGRSITINGHDVTIVGVTAGRFHGATLNPPEHVWIPIEAFHDAIGGRSRLFDRAVTSVLVVGQRAAGQSSATMSAEFATLSAQLTAAYPVENKDRHSIVVDYSSTVFLPIAQMAPRFLAVFSVVTVLTLLIVSANVANLMLARAITRQRETAVRQSLGASRGRIVRMLVAEGAAVTVTAWIAACVFAWWVARALLAIIEPTRRDLMPDFSPDWRMAAYAMALAVAATLAFTLAPALRTWRQPVLPSLRSGEPQVAAGRSRLSSALVVVQLAFSVVLLTSAGLAYRSLSLLAAGDVGFNPDQLLLVTLRTRRTLSATEAPPTEAEKAASRQPIERLREAVHRLPNVVTVSYNTRVPGAYLLSGIPVRRLADAEPVLAMRRWVGPGYLRALELTPRAGREIESGDTSGAMRAAVINQHLADRLWPRESPLGQTIFIGPNREVAEVVGIAPNALYDGPTHDPQPNFVFLAEQQNPGNPTTDPSLFIRYRGSLEAMVPAVGKVLADTDASVPVVSMSSMTSRLDSVAALERQVATLLTCFAIGSLAVAVLGQYAIAAFNMRRRTRDFGVRLALGASSGQLRWAVVGEALGLTLVGLLLGFALSVAVGTAARSALFGVTPTDPLTYASVSVLLAVASTLASSVPAWRAGQVNVVEALRQE